MLTGCISMATYIAGKRYILWLLTAERSRNTFLSPVLLNVKYKQEITSASERDIPVE
jgi:hypothetical protein